MFSQALLLECVFKVVQLELFPEVLPLESVSSSFSALNWMCSFYPAEFTRNLQRKFPNCTMSCTQHFNRVISFTWICSFIHQKLRKEWYTFVQHYEPCTKNSKMNNAFFVNGDAIDITDYPFSLSVGGDQEMICVLCYQNIILATVWLNCGTCSRNEDRIKMIFVQIFFVCFVCSGR